MFSFVVSVYLSAIICVSTPGNAVNYTIWTSRNHHMSKRHHNCKNWREMTVRGYCLITSSSKLVYSPTFHFGLDSHVFLYISASCCPLRQSCEREWNHVYDNNIMAVYYKFFCFAFFFLLFCVFYVSKVFLITICGHFFFLIKKDRTENNSTRGSIVILWQKALF